MQKLDKKSFTLFLEHTKTSPAIPENYNNKAVNTILSDVLAETGVADKLYQSFCELLVWAAKNEHHPGNVAASLWCQGFQMGRAYCEWLAEKEVLEKLYRAKPAPQQPGQAPPAPGAAPSQAVSSTPSPGQAPKPRLDEFGLIR